MAPSPLYSDAVAPAASRYDDAVGADGSVRPAWSMFARLDVGELREWQRHGDRLLDAEGAGHLVHELSDERQGSGITAQSRPWRVDPLPLVLDQHEHRQLVQGVTQRVRLLEAVLADLSGPQQLVRSAVVPARQLYSAPSLRATFAARRPGRWLTHAAVDVVRDADGRWRVVQDLVDTATGAGYALLNRSVLSRVMPEMMRSSAVAPISGFSDALRHALASSAPVERRTPRTVVLGGGPNHPAFIEHSYLAMQMGFHLVEASDLVVRANRVWLRALDGVEPVDVVYRRIDDAVLDPLDPLDAVSAGGVPAITWAARSSGVVLANAFGTRLVEELGAAAWAEEAAGELLGERLELGIWSEADGLATSPCWSPSTSTPIVPGHVVLRLHVAVGPDGPTVMAGGNGRVLAHGDHPTEPTSRTSKDVWVVGGSGSGVRLATVASQGQVDFGSSLTRRTADGLYWMGRAAERAEVAARVTRVIAGQLNQDLGLIAVGQGGWAHGALALLRSGSGGRSGASPSGNGAEEESLPYVDRIEAELAAGRRVVAAQISTVVDEAMAVRPYLSTTTGRVLTRLSSVASGLVSPASAVDDLDMVLVDLAALAGLSMESVVRGPAWRFLDLGRRIERALAVLGSIEAALAPAVDPLAFQPLSETLLWTNESLVAYRRRYRSDIELAAVLDLLVHDDANPRSLSFQLDRMREHVASLGWERGVALVEQASLGSITPVEGTIVGGRRLQVDALVLETRGPLLELGEAIVDRWFSDPVNPMVLGAP